MAKRLLANKYRKYISVDLTFIDNFLVKDAKDYISLLSFKV